MNFFETCTFQRYINIPTVDLGDISTIAVNSEWVKAQQYLSQLGPINIVVPTEFNDVTTFNEDIIINGDLTVNGEHTIINTTNTHVLDNIITLNSGEESNGITLGTSGIEIDRGQLENVSLVFSETNNKWNFLIGQNLSDVTCNDIYVNNLHHNGISPSEGDNIDQIKSFTKNLILNDEWIDTGIHADDLKTGTYIVQLYANDVASGGTNNNEFYSGILSWYNEDTNSTYELPSDEIALHRAGASNDGELFLRTFKNNNSNKLSLQIYSNTNNTNSSNYVFKFRRMI